MKYFLDPITEFIPSTGCVRTGNVVTRFQVPEVEWSCPDNGLGTTLSQLQTSRRSTGIMDTLRKAFSLTATPAALPPNPTAPQGGAVGAEGAAQDLVNFASEQTAGALVDDAVLQEEQRQRVLRFVKIGVGGAVLIGGGVLAWYLIKKRKPAVKNPGDTKQQILASVLQAMPVSGVIDAKKLFEETKNEGEDRKYDTRFWTWDDFRDALDTAEKKKLIMPVKGGYSRWKGKRWSTMDERIAERKERRGYEKEQEDYILFQERKAREKEVAEQAKALLAPQKNKGRRVRRVRRVR